LYIFSQFVSAALLLSRPIFSAKHHALYVDPLIFQCCFSVWNTFCFWFGLCHRLHSGGGFTVVVANSQQFAVRFDAVYRM